MDNSQYLPGASAASALSGNVTSGAISMAPLYDYVSQITARNNAHSAAEAANLRSWQERMTKQANEFNAAEAAKNRSWQEMMSNTAHQREIADLKAAGLNPVLSAMGGNGASVTSGSTAQGHNPSGAKGDTDMSGSAAFVSLLSSWLNNVTNMEAQRVSAEANLAIADKYNAMSKYTSELQSQTSLVTSQIAADTSRYVGQLHLAGTKYASDQSALTSQIIAKLQSETTKYVADQNNSFSYKISKLNSEMSAFLKAMDISAEFDLKSQFPQTFAALANQFFGTVFGSTSLLDDNRRLWGILDYPFGYYPNTSGVGVFKNPWSDDFFGGRPRAGSGRK